MPHDTEPTALLRQASKTNAKQDDTEAPCPTPRHEAPAAAGKNGAPRLACPECGESLIRIPRRFVDRVISLFVENQRFRCRGHTCRWRGNLAIDPSQNP